MSCSVLGEEVSIGAKVLQLPMKPELQAHIWLLRQLLLKGQGQDWSMAVTEMRARSSVSVIFMCI